MAPSFQPMQFGERETEPDPTGHRLFKVGKNPEASWDLHPGQQSYPQWLQRPDVKFHGTAGDPGEIRGPQHFGDFGTANEYARNLAYKRSPGEVIPLFDPEYADADADSDWHDDDESEEPSGVTITDKAQILARRLPQQHPTLFGDETANWAHMSAAYSSHAEVTRGVAESAGSWSPYESGGPQGEEASEALQAGKTIRYRNVGEASVRLEGSPMLRRGEKPGASGWGTGGERPNISYVANASDTRSHAQDVVEAVGQGLAPHPMNQYLSGGQFGTVPVEVPLTQYDRNVPPRLPGLGTRDQFVEDQFKKIVRVGREPYFPVRG